LNKGNNMPREYTPAIDCTNQASLPIAMQPVTSNQIRAVGYCHDTKTLAVSFTRGAGNVYEYHDVEPETACAPAQEAMQSFTVPDDLPGMWEHSDLTGGETDCAKPAQDVQSDPNGWCEYVAGMVFGWFQMTKELPEEDLSVAAIAGIIRRRLWAMPKAAPAPASGILDRARGGEQVANLMRLAEAADKAVASMTVPAPEAGSESKIVIDVGPGGSGGGPAEAAPPATEQTAPAPAQDEPFGYFRPAPFGWTDCAKDDEGAIALYERPQEVGLTDEERADMACAVAAICTGTSARSVAATAIEWTERAIRAKGAV
jgi:hypothetical protein